MRVSIDIDCVTELAFERWQDDTKKKIADIIKNNDYITAYQDELYFEIILENILNINPNTKESLKKAIDGLLDLFEEEEYPQIKLQMGKVINSYFSLLINQYDKDVIINRAVSQYIKTHEIPQSYLERAADSFRDEAEEYGYIADFE